MERTLMIVKPDAVGKNAIGHIIARVEGEGFVVRELQMVQLSAERAGQFYHVHHDKAFFGELIEFMTSGPAVPIVLERDNAVSHLRDFIGPTDSEEAPAGTIRGDFGTDVQCNAVHASDSLENASIQLADYYGE